MKVDISQLQLFWRIKCFQTIQGNYKLSIFGGQKDLKHSDSNYPSILFHFVLLDSLRFNPACWVVWHTFLSSADFFQN